MKSVTAHSHPPHPPLFVIIILLFPISASIQQKEVGGKEDLRPMKVITADPHEEWAAVKGVPGGMVSSMY